MHLRRLAFALVVTSAAIRAHAELPGESDPPPFSAITLPASSPTAAEVAPSNSPPPARPYGPLVKVDEPIATVNGLGDPESIEFRGLSQVRVEDVRSALQWDPMFQAAARPSNNTADFLTVLESRLLDGFQSSGFVDAKVSVTTDVAAKRFVVTVTEGQRFRQGKVVVTGDERVDAKQLSDRLTNAQEQRPWSIRYAWSAPVMQPSDGSTLWQPGENLNSIPAVRNSLKSGVRLALVEQGFPFASFELGFEPAVEPGFSDLRIKIIRLGPKATVDDIEIRGLKRDSREQVLKYLGIAVGQQLSGALLDEIDRKLTDSCRYWSHNLVVCCDPAPDCPYPATDNSTTLKLRLDVEEFTLVPPLSEPLSEVDEVLRKTAAWVNNYPSNDSPDLVVESTHGGQPDARSQFTSLQSAAAVDGRVVISLNGRPNGWLFEHTAFLSPLGLEVVDCGARQKFAISVPNLTTLSLKVSTDRNEEGSYNQKLFAGWNASAKGKSARSGKAIWTVRAVPVAVVYSAHRPDAKADIENGILTIKSPHLDIEINANTGALIRMIGRDTEENSEITVRMVPGGYDTLAEPLRDRFESFPNRYDSQQPISTLLKFMLEQLQQQPLLKNHDGLAKIFEAARLVQQSTSIKHALSQLDEAWLEKQVGHSVTTPAAQKFFLTPTMSNNGDSIQQIVKVNLIYYVPGLADRLFPRGSWPWTLTRESAFLVLGEGTGDDSTKRWNRLVGEFARLERDKQLGPIPAFCCLEVVRFNPENRVLAIFGKRIAACGIRQSSDEQLAQDIKLLASGDSGFPRTVQRLVDEFATLTVADQTAIIAILPENWGQLLSEIREERTERPNATAGEVLERVLHDRWQEFAGQAIDERLRACAATEVDVPKTAAQPSSKSSDR